MRIGERRDRLDARLEVVAMGRVAESRLLEDLRSQNAEESRNAAMVLARTGSDAALEALRHIVDGAGRPDTRTGGNLRHSALALGALGDAADGERLAGALRRVRRNDFRRALAYASGRARARSSVAALAREYATDKQQNFRSAVLIALG